MVSSATTYLTNGTSALATRQGSSHLRLVYNSRHNNVCTKASRHERHASYVGAFCVVMATVLLLGALSTLFCNVRHAGAVAALDSAKTELVTVGLGDTLWSVASERPVAGVSTNDVVAWIRNRNDLQTSELHPGQRLVAPMVEVG